MVPLQLPETKYSLAVLKRLKLAPKPVGMAVLEVSLLVQVDWACVRSTGSMMLQSARILIIRSIRVVNDLCIIAKF